MEAKIYNFSGWVGETAADVLVAKYSQALVDAGFTVRDRLFSFFSPYGFTALYLLSESHFAIHTFPEEGKTYIELSSCVKEFFDNFKALVEADLLTG